MTLVRHRVIWWALGQNYLFHLKRASMTLVARHRGQFWIVHCHDKRDTIIPT
jgi:hypothetical protein